MILMSMAIVVLFNVHCSKEKEVDPETPKKADAKDYRWLVAIVGHSRQDDVMICAGAVISKTLVLSSAWCVEQMPGELSLFSGEVVVNYKRPDDESSQDASLVDDKDILSCINSYIFHPCYAKVKRCTNVICKRVSWKCDVVIVETRDSMEKDVSVVDVNFLEWPTGEEKDCSFLGFDYARIYDKGKAVEQFDLVKSNFTAVRGALPCNAREVLVEGAIWSKNRFVGSYRFLSMTSGFLYCGSRVAGVLMGKINTETCRVEDHHYRKSTRKFWMAWTYLHLHKTWIRQVIDDPGKWERSCASQEPKVPSCLTWFIFGVVIGWRHMMRYTLRLSLFQAGIFLFQIKYAIV